MNKALQKECAVPNLVTEVTQASVSIGLLRQEILHQLSISQHNSPLGFDAQVQEATRAEEELHRRSLSAIANSNEAYVYTKALHEYEELQHKFQSLLEALYEEMMCAEFEKMGAHS